MNNTIDTPLKTAKEIMCNTTEVNNMTIGLLENLLGAISGEPTPERADKPLMTSMIQHLNVIDSQAEQIRCLAEQISASLF